MNLKHVLTTIGVIFSAVFLFPTTTTGTTFKWDASSQQYSYNWSTKGFTPGYWYRIFAKLDDGTVRSVVVGVR